MAEFLLYLYAGDRRYAAGGGAWHPMTRALPRSGRAAGIGALGLGVAIVLPFLLSTAAVAATPRTGEFFEYDLSTHVEDGKDAYLGYSDSLRSHYRYSVESVAGDNVSLVGTGSWSYQDSEGLSLSGSETFTPTFSLTTRKYLSGIDVPVGDPANATVWFWIPTPVAVGQIVRILDDFFTVTSLSATFWQGAVPHDAVLLESTNQYLRNDAYGSFNATYQDRYFFDRETGYVIGELFTEQDVGTWQGSPASFRYRAELFVTASSYAIPLNLLSFSLVYVGVPAAVVLSIVGVIRVRRGPSKFRVGSKEFPTEVRIRKAKSPADVVGLQPDGSPFFAPFLPVFAERSIAEGDPVVLALADRRIMGMALLDKESGVGSLFATDERVAQALLKRLRMRDLFADATIPARVLRSREIDRFTILQLRNPPAVPYDSGIVRPMSADDLPAVIAIAENVYRGRARRFIQSSFQGGDLGFVAMSAGRVVGFGFATVVGSVARLHTLTVDAAQRARGLGTEIMNARLSALSALGIEQVIVEISRQNAASLRIATRAGFTSLGETVYYSRQPEAAPAAIQRQT